MKKITLLALCVALAWFAAGLQALPAMAEPEKPGKLGKPEEAIKADVTIGDKMFIAQTDDIYFNANDFIGKTIKLEGMFNNLAGPDDPPFYTVTRFGPGCCGNDGSIGFVVAWDEDAGFVGPENNDWVEAIGMLEWYEMFGERYLRLNLLSLEVLDVRGIDTVMQ